MRRFSVHRFSGLLLVAGVLSLLPCVGGLPAAPDKPVGGDGPQGKAPTETDPDEVLLRQAKVGTDDASLLDFLRKR